MGLVGLTMNEYEVRFMTVHGAILNTIVIASSAEEARKLFLEEHDGEDYFSKILSVERM